MKARVLMCDIIRQTGIAPHVILVLRLRHTRRQVAATGLWEKSLRVYYLQNKSLRHVDACHKGTGKGNAVFRCILRGM